MMPMAMPMQATKVTRYSRRARLVGSRLCRKVPTVSTRGAGGFVVFVFVGVGEDVDELGGGAAVWVGPPTNSAGGGTTCVRVDVLGLGDEDVGGGVLEDGGGLELGAPS